MADVPAIPTSRLRLEIADTEGNLRGKYTTAAKLAKGKGATLSDVLYVLTIRDEVFESPLTGVPTGFPDVIMVPDWSTLVPVPWERDLSAVLVDVTTKDHRPLEVDPRMQLRRSIGRMHAAGFDALFGVEYELYLFQWLVIEWLSPERVGLEQGPRFLLQATISIAAAAAAYRYVDRPILERRLGVAREIVLLPVACVTVVAATLLLVR